MEYEHLIYFALNVLFAIIKQIFCIKFTGEIMKIGIITDIHSNLPRS